MLVSICTIPVITERYINFQQSIFFFLFPVKVKHEIIYQITMIESHYSKNLPIPNSSEKTDFFKVEKN